ncbi:MAG TPA: hypothetical protein VFD84_14820 [Candidatus Binatia bacterium]|nr:hypothetical protein [Candidatus Binatia bacterium]
MQRRTERGQPCTSATSALGGQYPTSHDCPASADLPGPGAVALPGVVQLLP